MNFTNFGKTHRIYCGDNFVEVCEFGAYVTGWTKNGRQILYQEPNIKRTGIPLLFPFAGALKNDYLQATKTTLPQHGFARNVMWDVAEICECEIRLQLHSTNLEPSLQAAYPFEFEATVTVQILPSGDLHYKLLVTNTGSTPLPISPGLHPYFAINHADKPQLSVEDNSWKGDKTNWDTWTDFTELPFSKKAVAIWPNGGIKIQANEAISRLIIWSGEAKNYVCIEPIARPFNAINTNPIQVEPAKTWVLNVQFTPQNIL